MRKVTIALDSSSRQFDVDGRLHIARSHISKSAVNPYYGEEIPGYQSLGLDAKRVYHLLRDPAELEKAAPTFARLPILSRHIPVTVDSPQPDLIVGSIGSDVSFNAPYLDADLCVWDSSAIAGIETGKVKELSCGYRYVPVMEAGEFNDMAYDGRMTEIKGNHLALVEVGRAGSDVVVADSNPFHEEKPAMKMSKLGKALFAALSAASPTLAADSALPALVGQANSKTFDRQTVKAKLLALDASLDPQQLDNVIDALLDVEQEPKPTEPPMAAGAGDESPADKVRKMLAGKVDDETINAIAAMCAAPVAEDGCDENSGADLVKKADVEAAMDSMRREFREAAEAARDVRSVVGDVAMDSAEAIYSFALDHMKVDRKDVQGVAALRALFRVASTHKPAQPQAIAQDSASALAKFPGLSRFHSA